MDALPSWWVVVAIGCGAIGVVLTSAALFWWTFADFLLAIEMPFVGWLEQWRQERRVPPDEHDGSALGAGGA
jgi:hypothetical protein